MGLDTIATTPGTEGEWEPAPDEPFAGLHLVGGMHSGGADSSSIRGKVYSEVVLAATGESLYQERIDPDAVVEMARRLGIAVGQAQLAGTRTGEREIAPVNEHGRLQLDEDGRRLIKSQEYQVLSVAGVKLDAGEAEDLARWFEVCAERGYAVEGWW